MLRFEPDGFASVLSIWRDSKGKEKLLGNMHQKKPEGFLPFRTTEFITAAELRAIADKLDELNGEKK